MTKRFVVCQNYIIALLSIFNGKWKWARLGIFFLCSFIPMYPLQESYDGVMYWKTHGYSLRFFLLHYSNTFPARKLPWSSALERLWAWLEVFVPLFHNILHMKVSIKLCNEMLWTSQATIWFILFNKILHEKITMELWPWKALGFFS